uniref:Putative ovule protein n=1 Tax=Solanum chacoense TaxID=4108 RepID=A0A0V0GUF1_SOLCH
MKISDWIFGLLFLFIINALSFYQLYVLAEIFNQNRPLYCLYIFLANACLNDFKTRGRDDPNGSKI